MLRDPSSPASFQLPPATVSCAPSPLPHAPQAVPAKPWGTRHVLPFQPSQGTYQLWGQGQGARGFPARQVPSLIGRAQVSAFSHVCASYSLSSSRSPFLSDCLCLQLHPLSLSLSNLCPFQSLLLMSLSRPPSLSHTHTHITFSPNLCFCFCLNLFLSNSQSLFLKSLSHSPPLCLAQSLSPPHFNPSLFLSLALHSCCFLLSLLLLFTFSSSLSQFLSLCWSLPPSSRPRCCLPSQSLLTPPLSAFPPQPDPWLSCPHS